MDLVGRKILERSASRIPLDHKHCQNEAGGIRWKTLATLNSYGSMVQQDGNMPGNHISPTCPLIQPFLFLTGNSDEAFFYGLRFTDLRSSDILNGLILPDAKSSNGTIRLTFEGLPMNGAVQSWSVEIDEADPDFKPRRISRVIHWDGKSPIDFQTIFTLSEYTNIAGYHFPLKLAFTDYRVPKNTEEAPILSSTGTVTVASLKLPSQIPDATFRLDESKADHIWNTAQSKGYGVGLLLGEEGTNIVVKRIIMDSPAGRQNKLHVGDKILFIANSGGKDVPVHAGRSNLARTQGMLQGDKGTLVSLTFVPAGKDDSQKDVVSLVRGEVKNHLCGVGSELLTKGTKAPDIEMHVLTNGASEHLSDFEGKVVVLEFWASWCSPCQRTMANLQLEASSHPEWKDKVVLLAASVDDTAAIAAKHIKKKGWNQTHNVWLESKGIKPYHVGGIPVFYIVDGKGTIAASGVGDGEHFNIAEMVDHCMNTSGSRGSNAK